MINNQEGIEMNTEELKVQYIIDTLKDALEFIESEPHPERSKHITFLRRMYDEMKQHLKGK